MNLMQMKDTVRLGGIDTYPYRVYNAYTLRGYVKGGTG